MKKKLKAKMEEAMVKAAAKTFSDMAFIDANKLESLSEDIQFSHIVQISLFKPIEGKIALYLPSECKKMIVENIYGIDWKDLKATDIDDCLLEILNVLAGNFLKRYCGDDVKLNISLPELLFDKEELNGSSSFMDIYFDAEGIPFKVSIYLKA